MRKPLTLLETVIASVLAAILLTNLLQSLYYVQKKKKRLEAISNEVLGKAESYTRLRQFFQNGSLQFEEGAIICDGKKLSYEDGLIVDGFGIPGGMIQLEFYEKKNGVLQKTDEPTAPLFIRILIDKEPFTFNVQPDKEGIALCK